MQLKCMEEEGIEILAENIQKKNFIRKIPSQTEEKWIWVCGLDSSGLGYLSVSGYKTFSLQKN